IDPGSPWQNGIAERLIGTLRRECLDQVIICGEAHLRRILSAYAAYYNQARTHLALQKDAPLRRAAQRSGAIVAIPILCGLHHQYVRMYFSERTTAKDTWLGPEQNSGRTEDGEKLGDSDWCIHAAGSVATLSISGRFGPRYPDPPDRPG